MSDMTAFYSYSSPEPGKVVIHEDVASVEYTEQTLGDAIVELEKNKAGYADPLLWDAEFQMLARAYRYLKEADKWWAARKPVTEKAVTA